MDDKGGIGIAGTMWLYAIENFIGMLIVIFFVKETSGHTAIEKKMLYVTEETKNKIALESASEKK